MNMSMWIIHLFLPSRRKYFLSHAGPDKQVAVIVARLLHSRGLGYWLDILNCTGKPDDAIFRAIDRCYCFVLFNSSHSDNKSEWCTMEYGHARGIRKRIECINLEQRTDGREPRIKKEQPGTSMRYRYETNRVNVAMEIEEYFAKFVKRPLDESEVRDVEKWLFTFSVLGRKLDSREIRDFVNGEALQDLPPEYTQALTEHDPIEAEDFEGHRYHEGGLELEEEKEEIVVGDAATIAAHSRSTGVSAVSKFNDEESLTLTPYVDEFADFDFGQIPPHMQREMENENNSLEEEGDGVLYSGSANLGLGHCLQRKMKRFFICVVCVLIFAVALLITLLGLPRWRKDEDFNDLPGKLASDMDGNIENKQSPGEPETEADQTKAPATVSPTEEKTISPTSGPMASPTVSPTAQPNVAPYTAYPTLTPMTAGPTVSPTASPTVTPTGSPTASPTTSKPSLSVAPSISPSIYVQRYNVTFQNRVYGTSLGDQTDYEYTSPWSEIFAAGESDIENYSSGTVSKITTRLNSVEGDQAVVFLQIIGEFSVQWSDWYCDWPWTHTEVAVGTGWTEWVVGPTCHGYIPWPFAATMIMDSRVMVEAM